MMNDRLLSSRWCFQEIVPIVKYSQLDHVPKYKVNTNINMFQMSHEH